MNYKLKHLAKYCCKPATEAEFEAVKMAAELGGVDFRNKSIKFESKYPFTLLGADKKLVTNIDEWNCKEIPVLDFIKKLRMTEEEARELEDDRVRLSVNENWEYSRGCKSLVALNGHYFKTNEDGTEVTLHKK